MPDSGSPDPGTSSPCGAGSPAGGRSRGEPAAGPGSAGPIAGDVARPGPGVAIAGSVAVFAAALTLYAMTANRGAQWQDSGFHILRVVTGEVFNPLGLALSHPLHHWLGRLAVAPGLIEPAFAVTLVSALSGAAAVACVFGSVLSLTGRPGAALFAAASLMLANTFWQMSTLTETYTLCAALLAAECWCLVSFCRTGRRGALLGMLALNGLGVANHLLAGLTTPVLGVVALVRRVVRPRDVVLGAVLWIVGTLPYSGMVLMEWVRTGDFTGTLHSALFGHAYAEDVLNLRLDPQMLLVAAAFPLYSFPNLLIPAAVYGLMRARRLDVPGTAIAALTAGLLIHLVFVLRYSITDQQTFFVPMYAILSILGGVGAAAVLAWGDAVRRRRACLAALVLLILTPGVYAVAPEVARRAQMLERIAGPRDKPYRDDYTYLLRPWSVVETSAERLGTEAVALAGERGLILVEDSMARFAIEYHRRRAGHDDLVVRVDAGRTDPDVRAERDALLRDAASQGRPVVLVPLDVARPRIETEVGSWQRRGDLYMLKPARPREPPPAVGPVPAGEPLH